MNARNSFSALNTTSNAQNEMTMTAGMVGIRPHRPLPRHLRQGKQLTKGQIYCPLNFLQGQNSVCNHASSSDSAPKLIDKKICTFAHHRHRWTLPCHSCRGLTPWTHLMTGMMPWMRSVMSSRARLHPIKVLFDRMVSAGQFFLETNVELI